LAQTPLEPGKKRFDR